MKYLMLIPLSILIASCLTKQTKQQSETIVRQKIIEFAIISRDSCESCRYNYPQHSASEISAAELDYVKSTFDSLVNSYNKDELSYDYRMQIVPMMNDKKEKVCWINCFCPHLPTPADWKQKEVVTIGGGSCYFNYEVNLEKKKIDKLVMNGPK